MVEKLLPGQWTKERIWQWYDKLPWLRGCNFMPADCIDPFEQWQAYDWDKKLKTAEKELDMAASIGFNSIRIRLYFEVWEKEKSFMDRLEQFLAAAHKRGISVMPRFGQDCLVPKEEYIPFTPGPQMEPQWGFFGGIQKDPWARKLPGWSPLDDPQGEKNFYEFVKTVVKAYGQDERIVMWEIWNEPGNSQRDGKSMEYMKNTFKLIRELEPIQPLSAGAYSFPEPSSDPLEKLMEIEKVALDYSDIINFHYYKDPGDLANIVRVLKAKYGRPMIITEWLHRIQGNNYINVLPLLFMEKIGSYSYGFREGKAQHYECWEGLRYQEGLDLKEWMHDIFRWNTRPYDPAEINLIKKLTKFADDQFHAGTVK